uniref:Acetyltransferase (GNAT) family putative n=1 Tax=Albugo laibachii Nc14 TaxID=890382 RepID=F0WT49_9STRA|nr:acetyltransferase (GNAT) family putative [Albugo laibachii Nc14]|eukprot:CCA24536.1 acetyltransferase (GNAT) family putative [Albugo laibachii Nc14]
MAGALRVIQAGSEEELKHVRALRFQVFVREQGFSASSEIDAFDDSPSTKYYLGYVYGEPIATARCVLLQTKDSHTKPHHVGKIGRFAVSPLHRRKGFGRQLLQGMEALLENEVDLFTLHAQYYAKEFYEKCGYTCVGAAFKEEGADHIKMQKRAFGT